MRIVELSLLAALLQPAPHQADSPNENRIGLPQLVLLTAQVDVKVGVNERWVWEDLPVKLESYTVFSTRVDIS